MIARLTRLGLELGSADVIDEAAGRLASECAVLLKGFLAPDILADLQGRIATARFDTRVHTGVEVGRPPVDLVLNDYAVDGRVHFLLNDPALFDLVRRLTGCDPIGCFMATVFKMMASDGHFDTWHSDVDGNRMVALSVNLSDEIFEGGLLQIMDAGSHRILYEGANTGMGDAVLFLISPRLRHKVADVVGRVPRVVLAGWFQREPQYARKIPRVPLGAA